MKDYISKRQNSLGKIPKDEINECLWLVETYLTEQWLNEESNENPVSQLWRRKDWVSTAELFSFGIYIRSLRTIDDTWLKKQVSKVKSKNKNEIRGALFEIAAIGFLADENNIKPAKSNQAGYDAILKYSDKLEIRVSIKNFGLSRFNQDFNSRVHDFENHFQAYLKYFKLNKIQFLVDAIDRIPGDKEWKNLKDNLPVILKNYIDKNDSFFAFEDRSWAGALGNLSDENYSDTQTSYSLICSSVYHKNEEANIISKIEDACANLIRHSNQEDVKTKNMLLIHLPSSASINNCHRWTSDYLINNPHKPISIVVFYQPVLAQDIQKDRTFIQHCFKAFIRESLTLPKESPFKIAIPVGIFSSEPALNKVIANGVEALTVDERYITQKGRHYINASKKPDGSYIGNVQFQGPGIKRYLNFPEPFDRELIFEGIFAPDDELRIL